MNANIYRQKSYTEKMLGFILFSKLEVSISKTLEIYSGFKPSNGF
jgi:hypothetical protein